MAKGEGETRPTPALVFCFNRDECWSVAESSRADLLLPGEQRRRSTRDRQARLDAGRRTQDEADAAPRRRRPSCGACCRKYRRVVEDLFEKKLLAVAVCTETLAAGINLPARSVVLTTLVKGPHGKEKLIDASTAHQIFGRAGRPQFDDRGHVFALAHEDDVRILRWKEKYDAIPEDTQGSGLIKAKKLSRRRSRRAARTPLLERGPVQAVAGCAAGQAVQQRTVAVAVAGLPAEAFAGGVARPRPCSASG